MRVLHVVIPTLATGLIALVLADPASADFINGDFATGDLTGWTASAIDRDGNPVAPLITVEASGRRHFARFRTGTFASGPFVSTLQQTVTIDPTEPFLNFGFSTTPATPDPTGTGTSSFLDAWTVSIGEGSNTYVLLLSDRTTTLADPFGSAPGNVSLAVSNDPFFQYQFAADLSAFSGKPITLFFDMTNEEDGFQFNHFVSFIGLAAPVIHIPEPNSLLLLGLGVLGILSYYGRRRKRVA